MSLASTPYRWPYHGRFAPARTALLICVGDVPGHQPQAATLARAIGVTGALRQAGVAAVLLPSAAEKQRPFDEALCDAVVERPSRGGFTGSPLAVVLRKLRRTDLIIAGMPFEIGADCTMRQANDLGFECLALEDCSTGLTPETFAGAMSSCQMSGGIFGAVATSDEVLALLRRWQAAQA